MTRWMRATAVMLAALAWCAPPAVTPAHARQAPVSALYMVYNDPRPCGGSAVPYPACVTTRLMRASAAPDHGRIDWVRDVPTLFDIKEAYVTPDGGTVVYLGVSLATGPGVYLHDVTTGRTTTVGPFHGARLLLGNPARPEVYVFDAAGVLVLSPSGIRRVLLDCQPNDRAGISADGLRASVTCSSGAVPMTLSTTVFDTVTGATLATHPYYGKISADGSVLYTRDFANGVFLLQRRTLVTGRLLSEVVNPGFELIVDQQSGNLVTFNRGGSGHLIDGLSLDTLWSPFPGASSAGNGPEPVLDAGNGMLFTPFEGGGLYVSDTRARRTLGYFGFRALMWAQLAVGPAPPAPPTGLGSRVDGTTVALSWTEPTRPGTVTRHVIEVGSAPGLANIYNGLDVGLQTSFSASGVPPGTYYVRVRAGNYTGLSAPSNEVEVTVP